MFDQIGTGADRRAINDLLYRSPRAGAGAERELAGRSRGGQPRETTGGPHSPPASYSGPGTADSHRTAHPAHLMRFRTFLITLPFSLVAACAMAQRPAASPRPTLIVFITVDQMRSDYFQRFDKQLTGGLRRLFDSRAFFLDGYQDHAITETAPGHSVTLSGRFPVHTGITMNAAGVNGVSDAAIIGSSDRLDPPASPVRFQGSTLVDWLKAANPGTRFLSVSRKDRGAILP